MGGKNSKASKEEELPVQPVSNELVFIESKRPTHELDPVEVIYSDSVFDQQVFDEGVYSENIYNDGDVPQEDGEKYLILKKKFRGVEPSGSVGSPDGYRRSSVHSNTYESIGGHSLDSDDVPNYLPPAIPDVPPPLPMSPPPLPTSPPPPMMPQPSFDAPYPQFSSLQFPSQSPKYAMAVPEVEVVTPPSPPPKSKEADPPPVPPRRRSSDKIRIDNKENEELKSPRSVSGESETNEGAQDARISVKERTQVFNKIVSENSLNSKNSQMPSKKRFDKDDVDTVSVNQLDTKSREWLVRCAQGNYQALAKLASENPHLPRIKDPSNGYTALHWAAKHGNEDIVKLIAGNYKVDVNSRTNGGYTPLHIAMQFSHEEVYQLLVTVYSADSNLRDWSGKKPRQYLVSKDQIDSVKILQSKEEEKPKASAKIDSKDKFEPSGTVVKRRISLRHTLTMPRKPKPKPEGKKVSRNNTERGFFTTYRYGR